MDLNTKDLKLQGLNAWDIVDFSEVENIEQLKDVIIKNYVSLCRKCTSSSFCKFYDSKEQPCPVLVKIVRNFIDMTVKSVDIQNRPVLEEFIRLIIALTQIFEDFENWQGMLVSESFKEYYKGYTPTFNSAYCHGLLVELSNFANAYRIVKTERSKVFFILVEGDSECEALPSIFSELGASPGISIHYNKIIFRNIKGKDSAKKQQIRLILTTYREEDADYFLILDNDANVKGYVEDLKREKLIEENHYLIWENKFEDNFGEEAVLKALEEEVDWIKGKIDVERLKKYNSTRKDIGKSIKYILRDQRICFDYNGYKVRIARRLAKRVCEELKESVKVDGGYDYITKTPKSKSFPVFVEKLREITKEINRITSEFHGIENQ